MKRWLWLLSVCSVVHAVGIFPRGCEPTGFGFQDRFVTLNDTGTQRYFLIHNHSSQAIQLERISTTPVFMTPKLQAKLDRDTWGAFASDLPSTHFACGIRMEDGHLEPIQCVDVVDICQYPRVRFALSNQGTYWVSTNKTQAQVIRDTTQKGIYLKW